MLCVNKEAEERLEANKNLKTSAHDLLIKARSLNLEHTFNQEAYELLVEAVKLNPHLIEAWIELTKCYQRRSDIEGAITCLESALEYCDSSKPNKIILRKLSTCIRQRSCESQEAKIATLLRSLDLSKQALKADLFDEENYYNLAKAYMCLFFVTECVDRQLIYLSKAAYVKALTLSNEKHSKKGNEDVDKNDISHLLETSSTEDTKPFMEQSDFLFNFATVLVYLQEFQKALEYLRVAVDLDKEWEEPKLLEECLIDYLKQINSMSNELTKNNKRVVRRYSKLVEPLKNVNKLECIIQLDQQRLRRSSNTQIRSLSLDQLESTMNSDNSISNDSKTIDELPAGVLSNTVNLLHLKLLNTINYNQAMYLTFMGIDQYYSLIVVTIYNLSAPRCPSPKDVVTIVEPKIEMIFVNNLTQNAKESNLSYKRINVREYKDVYVNGRRISTDQVSKPQFKVTVLP